MNLYDKILRRATELWKISTGTVVKKVVNELEIKEQKRKPLPVKKKKTKKIKRVSSSIPTRRQATNGDEDTNSQGDNEELCEAENESNWEG